MWIFPCGDVPCVVEVFRYYLLLLISCHALLCDLRWCNSVAKVTDATALFCGSNRKPHDRFVSIEAVFLKISGPNITQQEWEVYSNAINIIFYVVYYVT
jgi:hypothetical protein